MLRLALGTLALAVLSSVCLAGGNFGHFPSPDSQVEERLAAAIRSGDLSSVKTAAEQVELTQNEGLKDYVLRHGSGEIVRYLNQKSQLGIEELQIAVIENDLEAVKRLVPERSQRPPAVLRRDEHSPLRLAVRRGNVPMVKLLLQRNSAVNEIVPTFGPPGKKPSILSEAIQSGDAEIVRLLVETGIELEAPETNLIAVAEATYRGKPVSELLNSFEWRLLSDTEDYQRLAAEKEALLKELLAKGLVQRVEDRQANANCPLAAAIAAGREKVVAVLLEAGANPNVSLGGESRPLHRAVQTGHSGIVKLLIDAGADVNQPDAEGNTPLSLAYYGKGDIADLLRKAGAKEPPGAAGEN
jgi:ankyrin repeat protein